MNTIERAIIMAAGKGERLQPITYNTPKPLVKVNGVPMIESVINALHKNGIFEIYIVVGYLKEQFSYLEEKYNGIKLLENPYYESCNNISSLYVAREYIKNAFILDGDQIIYNSDSLYPDFERSGYNCVWTEEETSEWLMTVNDDEKVVSCSRTGGSNGWRLYSISRWNEKDGETLKKLLELEFEKNKAYSLFWDDVVMFCHPEKFDLGIYKMGEEDVCEIDSFDELCQRDSSYIEYVDEDKISPDTFINKHKEIWKFIKFSFTGISTSILEMAVFAFLQYVVFKSLNDVPVRDNAVLGFLGIEYKGYMWSYFLSALVGYTASFFMNRRLTFEADSNIFISSVLHILMVVATIAFNTWFGAYLG
ncbi:MAG: NTP transferase domain-containing protein, partial [Eubacterium sp.]|nr:NTP transferase domain-containing protein [Eubacterium sp.]